VSIVKLKGVSVTFKGTSGEVSVISPKKVRLFIILKIKFSF
jgi:hypothetical protein